MDVNGTTDVDSLTSCFIHGLFDLDYFSVLENQFLSNLYNCYVNSQRL
jgi:hypothetical protein